MASSLSIPPTRIHTPDSSIAIDRYPTLLNIYDSTEPTHSTETLNLNLATSQSLWVEVHDAIDELHTLRNTSSITNTQVGVLQQRLNTADAQVKALENQVTQQESTEETLHHELRKLRELAHSTPPYLPPPQRSPEHPDPDVFDGSDTSTLPNFLMSMQIKLHTNADWYPTDQAKLAYFTSRLRGRAMDQVAFGVTDMGGFTFKDVPEVISVLKTAYGDAMPKATAGQEILKLHQEKHPLKDFLPEWHHLANKSGFDDTALITLLNAALHPAILDRLSYNAASETITTLTSYLDLVRQADATLRRLRPNYHLTGVKSNTQEPPAPLTPLSSLPPVASLTTSNGGDAMDLSATSNKVVWTGNQGGKKRPKTPAEKTARRTYCYENDLCLWCESPDHKIRNCPTKPDQPAKEKAVSAAVTVTENK
jgi:hypothetical protein